VGASRGREAARAESLFRHVNERIEENARRFSVGRREYVCECSRLDCAEMVTLSSDEYDAVRANPTHFLVAPGHVDERLEQVVGGADGRYQVVEKRGEARSVAAELDERSETS
jgi:hypothetical protein